MHAFLNPILADGTQDAIDLPPVGFVGRFGYLSRRHDITLARFNVGLPARNYPQSEIGDQSVLISCMENHTCLFRGILLHKHLFPSGMEADVKQQSASFVLRSVEL